MNKKIILIINAVIFANIALAEMTSMAPPIDPLSHELVPVLFERIDKNENIEIKLLHRALNGPQTTLRAYSARILGEQGDETSIPYLIDALSDDSTHVGATYLEPGMHTTRYWANESLKALTSEDFGFIWDDPERLNVIMKWRQWYLEQYNIPQNTDTLIRAEDVDYPALLEQIGKEITVLRATYPQLADFSPAKHVQTETLKISYGYKTHEATHAGGWTSGVPNPDPDGIWFYLDFHDPKSTNQIHTQPFVQRGMIGEKEVMFLILEGENTKSVYGKIWEILKTNGVSTKDW